MYDFFEYIYYRIYKWQLSWFGESWDPEFKAVVGVTSLQFFNTFIILIIIEVIFQVKIIFSFDYPKIVGVLYGFILIIINYFLYMRRGKYLEIEKKYRNKSKNKLKNKSRLMWCYVGTILLFPVLFLIDAFFFDFYFKNILFNF